MSEEKVFVGPFTGGKCTIKNEVTDVGFFTSELGWFVHTVEAEQFGIGRNLLDHVDIVQGFSALFKHTPLMDFLCISIGLINEALAFKVTMGLPSEGEWELWMWVLSTFLIILGEIG